GLLPAQLLDARHRGLRSAGERGGLGLRLDAAEHLDVRADDEAVRLARGEDDGLDRGIAAQLREGPLEVLLERAAQRVDALAFDVHQEQRHAVLPHVDAEGAHCLSRMTAAPSPPAAQTEIS